MAGSKSLLRTVQDRLQELFDTLPGEQADVLEAVLTRTPQEEVRDGPVGDGDGDDRAIIIVGGRANRWFLFDVSDVLLNPQPLPPEPPDLPDGIR